MDHLNLHRTKVIIPFVLVLYVWISCFAFSFISGVTLKERIARPYDTAISYIYDKREVIVVRILVSHSLGLLPFLIGAAIYFGRGKKNPELHGSARFATYREIIKRYKNTGKGFLLARLNGKDIKIDDNGDNHILIKAETRSGKGVSWVVPFFFSFFGSIITLDIKLENFKITSGFRKLLGHKIVMLNFMTEDKRSDCFNAFDYMPDDKMNRVGFIQKMGHFISPTPPNSDPIWSGEARGLFEGLALMAADLDELHLSLGEIYRMLNTEEKTHDYLKRMIEENEDKLDPICKMNLYSYINTPDRTRGGVRTQLTSVLKPFSNPLIDAATRNSSFDVRKVKSHKMTIYVVVPPKYLVELQMVTNLFFQIAIDLNLDTEKKRDKTYKHNCLFLMDEFTSIGYMQTFGKKIEYVLSYGLQFALITHSTAQLEGVYGKYEAKNMSNNCMIKGFLTPNEIETAKELSDRLGTVTLKQTSVSKKYNSVLPSNESESLVKRPLMLPQEIMEMPEDKCFIFIKGMKPIYADRIFWYSDKLFKDNETKPPRIPLLKFTETQEIKSMKTIDINLSDFDFNLGDTDQVQSDELNIKAADAYLALIGED